MCLENIARSPISRCGRANSTLTPETQVRQRNVAHLHRPAAEPIELEPHDPADLITKLTTVDYHPEATARYIDGVLERVQPLPEGCGAFCGNGAATR